MGKRLLKVTIENLLVRAPIWELEHMAWHETLIGCPYCKEFAQLTPKLDVIQFGLLNNDVVHTVVQCIHCHKFYALHYINTQEVEE